MEKEENKKKALLVLGNGFDLACGYNTRFDDFYNYVLKYDHNLNDYNFFIQLLRETFYRNGGESNAFKQLLNVSSKENWMDIELVLNHFLFGKMYKYTLNVFNSFSRSGYHGDYSFPRLPIQNWLSNCQLNLKKGLNNFLMEHLNKFELSFCNYLEKDATSIPYNKKKVEKILNELVKGVDEYKIINFNYTMPCEEKKFIYLFCPWIDV